MYTGLINGVIYFSDDGVGEGRTGFKIGIWILGTKSFMPEFHSVVFLTDSTAVC